MENILLRPVLLHTMLKIIILAVVFDTGFNRHMACRGGMWLESSDSAVGTWAKTDVALGESHFILGSARVQCACLCSSCRYYLLFGKLAIWFLRFSFENAVVKKMLQLRMKLESPPGGNLWSTEQCLACWVNCPILLWSHIASENRTHAQF